LPRSQMPRRPSSELPGSPFSSTPLLQSLREERKSMPVRSFMHQVTSMWEGFERYLEALDHRNCCSGQFDEPVSPPYAAQSCPCHVGSPGIKIPSSVFTRLESGRRSQRRVRCRWTLELIQKIKALPAFTASILWCWLGSIVPRLSRKWLALIELIGH